MSGVRQGTRLDQLLQLRTKLDQEIASERHRVALDVREPSPVRLAPVDPFQPRKRLDLVLSELEVTSSEIKAWAKERGLIEEVKRGRIGWPLVEAWIGEFQPTYDLLAAR